ncbi:MAG: DUF5778 family protein [Halobacteriaceae archaeon]
MPDTVDRELYRRAAALLEPGEIELHGAVVHTDYTSDEETLLHRATVDIGDAIAAVLDAPDTYVYSGTDDPEFGLNQHQGLTLAADEFVWECQQLLRDGTYDIVVYWEATADIETVLAAIRDQGHRVVGVTEDGPVDTG